MHLGSSTRALGVFSLAMITIVSVDSIRNLPATALFGSSLIIFFALGALFFYYPAHWFLLNWLLPKQSRAVFMLG